MKKIAAIFFGCSFLINNQINASDYQWAVPVNIKDAESRAFLWIPPNCKHVRGLIFASQVILEKKFCDDVFIRTACEKEGLGIVIVFRSPLTFFNYKDGADKTLQKILDDLAAISGYDEVASAPLLTIGHSGAAIGAWNIAYWNPKRVIAILTLHAAASVNPPEYDSKSRVEGIPVMAVSGEYESWANIVEPLDKHWRWLRGDLLDIRAKYNTALVCEVVQPGAGHFNFDEHLAKLAAMFIEKAAHYRISKDTTSSQLNNLVEESGWLTDVNILSNDKFKPIAFKQFKGDASLAFWHMDEEIAKAVDDFPLLYGGKKDQRVAFVQNKKIVPASWINELQFQPNNDGISFNVQADFLSHTPDGVAGSGKPLEHAQQKIKFLLIGGWGGGGKQINDSTFQIKFDHFGISRFTNNIQVMAYAEGNTEFKYAEQAGQIKFPEKNTEGKEQTIKFPIIDSVLLNTNPITLKALSSEGMQVSYFVKYGPAEVKGNQLYLTSIPPKTKYPVKVVVLAYQWGRNIAPYIQSAAPIERTYYILLNKK